MATPMFDDHRHWQLAAPKSSLVWISAPLLCSKIISKVTNYIYSIIIYIIIMYKVPSSLKIQQKLKVYTCLYEVRFFFLETPCAFVSPDFFHLHLPHLWNGTRYGTWDVSRVEQEIQGAQTQQRLVVLGVANWTVTVRFLTNMVTWDISSGTSFGSLKSKI